mmetsp:Transcript_75084/g.176278  ORF Transcript_75084/g.176278 Transcript_75084/m.176278 type:complete len:200 (+) Transcript_75084:737-1336(+)
MQLFENDVDELYTRRLEELNLASDDGGERRLGNKQSRRQPCGVANCVLDLGHVQGKTGIDVHQHRLKHILEEKTKPRAPQHLRGEVRFAFVPFESVGDGAAILDGGLQRSVLERVRSRFGAEPEGPKLCFDFVLDELYVDSHLGHGLAQVHHQRLRHRRRKARRARGVNAHLVFGMRREELMLVVERVLDAPPRLNIGL